MKRIATLLLLLCGVLDAKDAITLDPSRRIALEDVFTLGFRPFELTQDSRTLRDWNPRPLKVRFPGLDVELEAEQVTFHVYDNNDISRIQIIENRSSPRPIEEIIEVAAKIITAYGEDPNAIIPDWRKEFAKHGRLTFVGYGFDIDEGKRVSIEVLPAGSPKQHANLSIVFRWNYLGKLSRDGYSGEPVTIPSEFQWDASNEAWRRLMDEKAEIQMQNKSEMATPRKPSD